MISEPEVYKFIRERVDAIGAEKVMSELEVNGTASVEFTTSVGSKACRNHKGQGIAFTLCCLRQAQGHSILN